MVTDDQLEAARRKVRNMLHAADNGNHIGESAVLRMAASADLLDRVWEAVNVLGAPDTACRTEDERAYCRAIGDALAEIEKLGARQS